jgi:hypothetical protein
MEFAPLVADPLDTLEPPSLRELDLLRTQIDPTGRTIAGDWILLEHEGHAYRRSLSPAAAR